MRRVVVTGIGLLTTLGSNTSTSWKALIEGKSGIKKITHFNVDDLPCRIAGYFQMTRISDYFNLETHIETKDIKETTDLFNMDLWLQVWLIKTLV